ncbi:MAG TPA: phosphotransferase family protein [Solirubrobacterales bacterium]|nr:phosphotransferase family protein [Solirubrobacterales bacterium]
MASPDEVGELRRRVGELADARFGGAAIELFEPLPGGHSGLTWMVELATAAGRRRIVVKSTPAGRDPVGRHDVLRQERIISVLDKVPGVEVPQVFFADEGPPRLFAMAAIEGRGDEPILDEGAEPEPAAEIESLWEGAVATLVALGAADPEALGLADAPVVGAAEEIERWSATARAAGPEVEALARPLAAALRTRLPAPPPRPALVHGDYRLGNMLRMDGRIHALIDWEIWSLGDPRTDLGWLTMFTEPGTFPGIGREVAGTPAAEQVLAAYEREAGVAVDDPCFFRALACFKLGSVQAHNLRRHREGRRRDPWLERFAAGVERLFARGIELLGG